MTAYRTVKMMINGRGEVHLAPRSSLAGYRKDNPIIEIVEVPDDVDDDMVIRTYSRCFLLPVMHADRPIPWHKISGAKDGQIIRLGPGRPHLDRGKKAIRVNVTLSPEAIAILDTRGNGRSQEIERLIRESASRSGGQDDIPMGSEG